MMGRPVQPYVLCRQSLTSARSDPSTQRIGVDCTSSRKLPSDEGLLDRSPGRHPSCGAATVKQATASARAPTPPPPTRTGVPLRAHSRFLARGARYARPLVVGQTGRLAVCFSSSPAGRPLAHDEWLLGSTLRLRHDLGTTAASCDFAAVSAAPAVFSRFQFNPDAHHVCI